MAWSEEEKRKIHEDLLQKRMIALYDDLDEDGIDDSVAARVMLSVMALNARSEEDPILLCFNSTGGQIDAGLDVFNILEKSKAPVIGEVHGYAHSTAVLVLQACKIRRALGNTQFILHKSKVTIEGTVDDLEREIHKILAVRKIYQEKVYRIFSKRTGQSLQAVKKQCAKNKPMTAEEALTFGLIDEII